jgi:hypothetical protein
MEKIHISKLYTTEKELLAENINKPTDPNPIHIEKIDEDKFYISNGRHRIAKQILDGKEYIEAETHEPFFIRLNSGKLISFLELVENFKKYNQKIGGIWVRKL